MGCKCLKSPATQAFVSYVFLSLGCFSPGVLNRSIRSEKSAMGFLKCPGWKFQFLKVYPDIFGYIWDYQVTE